VCVKTLAFLTTLSNILDWHIFLNGGSKMQSRLKSSTVPKNKILQSFMTQTSLLGNVQRLIEITELWELKKETQNIKNITNIFDIFGQTKTQYFVKIYATL